MVVISHPGLVLSGRCKLVQRVLLSAHIDSGAADSFLLSCDCFFPVPIQCSLSLLPAQGCAPPQLTEPKPQGF